MQEKLTGQTEIIMGVPCSVVKWRFGNKGRFNTAYRFTIPGWEECTVTGIRNTERVIRGRLDAAVRNTLGIQH